MAYLTLNSSDDNQNSCFKFIGANNNASTQISIITGESVGSVSLINSSQNSGIDTCSFYSGPSESTILSFGDSNWETSGSIASNDGYSSGNGMSYTGSGESCGSIASSSVSTSSFSGGCSYSC